MAYISEGKDEISQRVNRWYDRLGWAIIGAMPGSALGRIFNDSFLVFAICCALIIVLIIGCRFWEIWLRRRPPPVDVTIDKIKGIQRRKIIINLFTK